MYSVCSYILYLCKISQRVWQSSNPFFLILTGPLEQYWGVYPLVVEDVNSTAAFSAAGIKVIPFTPSQSWIYSAEVVGATLSVADSLVWWMVDKALGLAGAWELFFFCFFSVKREAKIIVTSAGTRSLKAGTSLGLQYVLLFSCWSLV